LNDGKFYLSRCRCGEFRPKKANRASHEGRGSARSPLGYGLTVGAEAGNSIARRAYSSPANRASNVRVIHELTLKVVSHDRQDPRMASDGRAAESSLIARRDDDNYAVAGRTIEGFF
jgi:hypothetical protein